jgi:type VI secretion system protein ImpA
VALPLDPDALLEPLDPGEPCGPDLELEGDLDFANGIARVEGLLPAAFFTRDDEGRLQPFDRGTIEFDKERKALAALLDRTRDLRVVALLARLAILDRDLAGFAAALRAVAGLLVARWEDVHPRGEDGDYGLRSAVLQSLDDMPTVILPLQHVPLAQSRRHGAITFRALMIADGEVAGREDEPGLDRGTIERVIEEAEPEILAARLAEVTGVIAAVASIRDATVAGGGHAASVNLERLGQFAGRIRDLLARPVPDAAPEEAAAGEGEPAAEAGAAPAASRTGLASLAQASAALAAAGLYLRRREPSSPAEVLVRQAQALVGKPFLEVMRILVPARAAETTIALGAARTLRLTFDQLAEIPEAEAEEAWASEPEEAPEPPRAASRAEAMALIREVAAFFRAHEPTSPIPLLLDRAVGLVDRDFMAILRDVLPEPE